MCGIAGFVDFKFDSSEVILIKMVSSMKHRGPDDTGIELFYEKNCLIGLGQARLSIIDLSSAGHQPMSHKNLTIVFNGEIYNYKEIRNELEQLGQVFRTETDTEVILQSFEKWGVECIHRFIGMFAFVIYDKNDENITVVRDRAGVKPFYYYYENGLFLFGSELKALMAHPRFKKEIDEAALPNYFQYGYIAAPHTIFKNTYKLNPGHILSIGINNQIIKTDEYWNINVYYKKPKLALSYQEAKEEVKNLMKSAFNYRMVSDVPVGVFLSGGYDSTVVTAMLQEDSKIPLKTFTIGFETGNNEAPYAKKTAAYLGTDHTEYICTTKEAQDIIPTLPFFYDEPFGDSSAIPTILVSKLAKQQVTVALSADAGDEIFCGYQTYFNLNTYLRKVDKIPGIAGKTMSSILKYFENSKSVNSSRVYHQLFKAMQSSNMNEIDKSTFLFQAMAEKPKGYIDKIFKSTIYSHSSSFTVDNQGFSSGIEVAMAIDFNSYLPNDILTKVDKASMSVSLEGREPLLDHRLVEFAAQIPIEFKYDGQLGKRILKDIAHDFVPKEMMDRPKTGFSLPIYSWLRNDLNYLIDEYLSEDALALSGLFNVKFLTSEIEKFKKNQLHYTPIIWYLLMFQMWWKEWMIDNNK